MVFGHDIFISYAREDDLPPPGGGPGWVTRLHHELVWRMRRRFGKLHPPRVWRDQEQLAYNQPIGEEIRARLEQTMLFFALYSSNYHASPNCREEWEHFHRHVQGSAPGLYLQPGNHCRFFNILLRNIDPNFWPPEFRECVAFPMCDSDVPGEMGDPTDPDRDPARYEAQMRRLVGAVEKILLLMPTPSPEPQRPARSAVFIAHVPDTLKLTRNRLVNELRRERVEVLPSLPPPYEPEHTERLGRTLGEAALSVHLLDGIPGHEVEGQPDRSYDEVQAEAALGAGVSQLVWTPDRAVLEESEFTSHRELLNRLEGFPRTGKAYRFLCGRPEDLPRRVLEELRRTKTVRAEASASYDVLIDADDRDHYYGNLLLAHLENRRIRCLLHEERDQAGDRVREFDDNLNLAKALVILSGQVDPTQVRRRLERSVRRRLDAGREGEAARLQHFSVFFPPGSRADPGTLEAEWGWLPVWTLDNRARPEVDPKAVQPLVDAVGPS